MDRLATLPLRIRANAAWTLAYLGRHDPNWGRMLNRRSLLERFRADPNPRVRRLAEGVLAGRGVRSPDPGRAA